MESRKLEEFNHWWIEGKVDKELALPFKRNVYFEILDNLGERFIISITGLRRIGKTTLIYQSIDSLIKNNVSKENILFYSFDDSSFSFTEVLEAYKEFQKKDFRKEKVYIFLDEIQKCKNWENELKKYYDLYPKLKFIVSGSESLFIKKKSKESLAGRIIEFSLNTFSFIEFLRFKGINKNDFRYETKIKPLFLEFIERGGFPETFELDSKKYYDYLQALVVDKIVFRDIPQSFNLDSPEFLKTLLELFSRNPGMYADYQSLSKQFGKDRRVIKDYIFYLKESFLINLLGNYRKGTTSLRKTKRVYVRDNGLIKIYNSKIDELFFSKMVENLLVISLGAESFWKDNLEVDVVKRGFPIEIKYKENIGSEDFKSLRKFMEKFNKKRAIIVTKNDSFEKEFDEGKIRGIPAWKFLLDYEEDKLNLN